MVNVNVNLVSVAGTEKDPTLSLDSNSGVVFSMKE
jgi:hypothetical protein